MLLLFFGGVVVLCGLLLLLCKVEVIGHSTVDYCFDFVADGFCIVVQTL